jgi:peptidoglycan hydrolase CwlO-like protein
MDNKRIEGFKDFAKKVVEMKNYIEELEEENEVLKRRVQLTEEQHRLYQKKNKILKDRIEELEEIIFMTD